MKTLLILGCLLIPSIVLAQTQTATFNLTFTDPNSGAAQEDGVRIENAPTSTGTFAGVGQVATNVTTFAHVILNDPGGVQQCYRVQAFNKTGPAPYSNIACATSPTVQVAPGPINVSVSVTVTVTTP